MRKRAFTLLELLAVMGIMMIMAAIAVSSYFGMTRGSAMRGAVSHLRSTLLLARQSAIMNGRKTYVIFDQSTTNAWYVLCMHEGTVTVPGVGSMGDKYSDLSSLTNSRIYRLRPPRAESSIITYYQPDPPPPIVQTPGINWSTGDKYGWEIHPKTYLPRGFEFVGIPDMVIFNADGTTRDQKYEIEIYEKISPGHIAEITVAALTGFISVEFK